MSKPAGRKGDKDTGHPGAGPTPVITASDDVIINGKGAARKGDQLKKHHKGKRILIGGSDSVLVNGRPAARTGDGINCGGVMIQGSPNVLIGDSPTMQKPTPIHFRQERIGETAPPPKQTDIHRAANIHHDVPVEYDPLVEEPPILKDIVVRMDIDPATSPNASNQFVLSSSDGSVSQTLTASSDMIPGDQYLDLKFTALDISKNYRLEEIDSDGDAMTHFDLAIYDGVGSISPAPDDKKKEASEQDEGSGT